jgi:hypothetical protein
MRILVTICALAFATGALAESIRKEEPVQRTLRFAGPGPRTLEVSTIMGNIRVEGYDGSDVVLTAKRSTTADSAADLEAAQRDVVLDVAEGGSTIKAIVRYLDGEACGEDNHRRHRDWPDYDVRYDFVIKVPRDTRLVLCTINDGHLDVKGTRADFILRSVNGPIDMADMGGSGEATTVNGAVKGSFSAPPRSDSVFRTVNGSIVLTMPKSFTADLKMKTFNGGLYTDFDTQPTPSRQSIVTERKGSKTIYQIDQFALVSIGKGGPEMTMDTLNGDVRVLRGAP